MQLLAKMRASLLSMVVYLCYLVGACILTMLIEAMFIFLLDHVVLLSYSVLTVIRIIIYTVGVPAIIGFLGYYEGYREARCPIGETVFSYLPAAVIHLLLSMLFKFQGFISGAVRFTAGYIHNGSEITYENLIEKTPYSLFLLVFLGYTVLYALILLICKFFGSKKRIIRRAEMRRHEIN